MVVVASEFTSRALRIFWPTAGWFPQANELGPLQGSCNQPTLSDHQCSLPERYKCKVHSTISILEKRPFACCARCLGMRQTQGTDLQHRQGKGLVQAASHCKHMLVKKTHKQHVLTTARDRYKLRTVCPCLETFYPGHFTKSHLAVA